MARHRRHSLGWITGMALVALPLLVAWPADAVPTVSPDVLASWPHDPEAFTQGLVLHCGLFYESTGLYGRSSVRQVDPHTGDVLRIEQLSAAEFGEGLSLVDNRLIQITWKNGIAHEYERDSFHLLQNFEYAGEGWGLCYDGNRLVMSDGSSELFFRDPESFELLGQVTVTVDGNPVLQLNELECVGNLVYANVWMTNWILRIDPVSGQVLSRVDASGLLTPEEAGEADVLNGIAYHPTSQHFFIGGKLWPRMFEVRLPFPPDAGTAYELAGADGGSPLMYVGDPEPAELATTDCERAFAPPPASMGPDADAPHGDGSAGAAPNSGGSAGTAPNGGGSGASSDDGSTPNRGPQSMNERAASASCLCTAVGRSRHALSLTLSTSDRKSSGIGGLLGGLVIGLGAWRIAARRR